MASRLAYQGDLTALGHEIARLRRERNWSIEMLAGASGVGRLTIIATENAQRVPKVNTLYALVKALGGDLSDVVRVMDSST